MRGCLFTGLITHLGTVRQRTAGSGVWSFAIEAEGFLPGVEVGESISVNGVCLTVVNVFNTFFEVEVVHETQQVTALGDLKAGSRVNLERAVAVGGRFGGHFVQGHVDGIGRILKFDLCEGSRLLHVAVPEGLRLYLIPKGSVAIDGISLTIQELTADGIQVAVIPHTFSSTNLHLRKPQDAVNLEVDFLGKYVVQYCQQTFSKAR